jgi:hypothetical protein
VRLQKYWKLDAGVHRFDISYQILSCVHRGSLSLYLTVFADFMDVNRSNLRDLAIAEAISMMHCNSNQRKANINDITSLG